MDCLRLAILLLFPFYLQAQRFHTLEQTDSKVRKWYAEARSAASGDQLAEAIRLLRRCVERDSLLTPAYAQLGNVLHDRGDYDEALLAFKKVFSLNPNHDHRLHYAFGLTAFKAGKYELAEKELGLFIAANPDSPRGENAKRVRSNARFAALAVKQPVPFSSSSLSASINTIAPEYLPALSADGKTLLFTRVVGGQEDIYMSSWDSVGGDWGTAVPLVTLNTPGNEGAHSLSADGSTLVFTRCDDPKGAGSCDLYISYRKGNVWTTPRNMGAPVNTAQWETMPSLSASGDGLYFTSRRPGGQGGADIWFSRRLPAGQWSVPENVGPQVNSSGDDQAPFMHADGQTLFFMSDGHPGMGGFDLFMAQREGDGQWSVPRNLGYPINTLANEGALCIDRTGETAYFSASSSNAFAQEVSQRANVDIFRFTLPPAVRPIPVTFVEGKIRSMGHNEPLSARVYIRTLNRDSLVLKIDADAEGRFFACLTSGTAYSFAVMHPGYIPFSDYFPLHEPQPALHPYQMAIFLEKIPAGPAPPSAVMAKEVGQAVVLRNVFFESGSARLDSSSVHELNRLRDWLKEYDQVCIQLNGHTDNTGPEALNIDLSASRAQAVRDYLVATGIESRRLRVKGYGSGKPVADNSREEGRRENRRTEFILLE